MKQALDYYYRFLKAILILLLGLMVIPVFLQIVSRHTGLIPRYIWTEEIARFCFVWLIMIGSIIAVRDGSHFDVILLPEPKTNKGLGVSRMIKHLAMLGLAYVFLWHGIVFAKSGLMQHSEVSGINMLSIYISFPIAGLSWTLFLIEALKENIETYRKPEPDSEDEA